MQSCGGLTEQHIQTCNDIGVTGGQELLLGQGQEVKVLRSKLKSLCFMVRAVGVIGGTQAGKR